MTLPLANLADKPVKQIIVIGAGLCGLATAIGLRKFGYTVTILERNSELQEVNQVDFTSQSRK